jgi:mono/diheme cytochrome c family protein
MRHLVGQVVTYTLGAILVVGAALFAKLRSAQTVITTEAALLRPLEPAPGQRFEWEALGATSYAANCRNCHGASGAGWDQYPGLQAVSKLVAAPDGRAYFVGLHLFGVASDRWRAPMPPMGHMQDVELAAVMNHVLTNFGNALPKESLFRPEEVREQRASPRTPREVDALRPASPVQLGARSLRGPGEGGASWLLPGAVVLDDVPPKIEGAAPRLPRNHREARRRVAEMATQHGHPPCRCLGAFEEHAEPLTGAQAGPPHCVVD